MDAKERVKNHELRALSVGMALALSLIAVLVLLCPGCTTAEKNEWKELAEETRSDTNKELIKKAKKKKKKALKKLEQL